MLVLLWCKIKLPCRIYYIFCKTNHSNNVWFGANKNGWNSFIIEIKASIYVTLNIIIECFSGKFQALTLISENENCLSWI